MDSAEQKYMRKCCVDCLLTSAALSSLLIDDERTSNGFKKKESSPWFELEHAKGIENGNNHSFPRISAQATLFIEDWLTPLGLPTHGADGVCER